MTNTNQNKKEEDYVTVTIRKFNKDISINIPASQARISRTRGLFYNWAPCEQGGRIEAIPLSSIVKIYIPEEYFDLVHGNLM